MLSDNDTDDLGNAPLLKSIPKLDPFVVPDGFFDRFPHQVQARIAHTDQRTSSSLWLRLSRAPALIGSLGTLLLVGLVWWAWPTEGPDPVAIIPETSLESDLTVLDELDDNQLYALWEGNAPPLSEIDLQLDTDDLIAYLENEELPYYLLAEEL